jgi:glycosyltransferase involved in cell wall biosynthesis
MNIACLYDKPLNTSGISLHAQCLSRHLNLKGVKSSFFDSKHNFHKEIHSFSHVFLNWDFNDMPVLGSFLDDIKYYQQSGVIPVIFVHGAFLNRDKAVLTFLSRHITLVTHSLDVSNVYNIPYVDLGIEVISFNQMPKIARCIGTFGYFSNYKNYEKMIDICKSTNSLFLCNLTSDLNSPIKKQCSELKKLCTKNGVKSIINSEFLEYPDLLSFLSQADVLLFLRDNPVSFKLVGSSSASVRIAMNEGLPVFCDNESLYFKDIKEYATVVDRNSIVIEITRALEDKNHYEELANKTISCLETLRWESVINFYIERVINIV